MGIIASRATSQCSTPAPRAGRRRGRLAIVALCLGLQPDVPAGTVSLNPVLPRGLHRIEVHGIPVPRRQLSLAHDGDGAKVIEAPPGLRVEAQAGPFG